MVCLGYKFMIVTSGSMEPTLPVGSLVIVTPCEYEDLELNDIVTMEGSGINFTHRIVGKRDVVTDEILEKTDPRYNDGVWYTKGDNNDTLDGAITSKEIVGKVYEEHCFTFVGSIVRYAKSNYKMLIVMGVILVAFIEVMNYLKGKLETDDIECYETDEE